MSEPDAANAQQIEYWNTVSGPKWVALTDQIDAQIAPIGLEVMREAAPSSGEAVLDIGCGCGLTTLELARRAGPTGRVVGIDISRPMLADAERRAAGHEGAPIRFVAGDAQTWAFEAATFDLVFSRFGVMFFDDPDAAFTNLRRALRSSGKLAFVAWRSPAENPFMTTAKRAAEPLLSNMPTPDPNAPGQFAFADGERVRQILERSGWSRIDIRPLDVEGHVSEQDLLAYVTKLGPVGVALRDVDEATRARVSEVVRAAFEPYVQNGSARFMMACWLVTATT
jgi:ubiquinone/menaquinone biosynthesis C-methylase UbiE